MLGRPPGCSRASCWTGKYHSTTHMNPLRDVVGRQGAMLPTYRLAVSQAIDAARSLSADRPRRGKAGGSKRNIKGSLEPQNHTSLHLLADDRALDPKWSSSAA